MTAARDFFDNLSETLMGRRIGCVGRGSGHQMDEKALYLDGNGVHALSGEHCHLCLNPVTDSQLADGDAYVKDSKGNDDGEYEHRECGQSLRYER